MRGQNKTKTIPVFLLRTGMPRPNYKNKRL